MIASVATSTPLPPPPCPKKKERKEKNCADNEKVQKWAGISKSLAREKKKKKFKVSEIGSRFYYVAKPGKNVFVRGPPITGTSHMGRGANLADAPRFLHRSIILY